MNDTERLQLRIIHQRKTIVALQEKVRSQKIELNVKSDKVKERGDKIWEYKKRIRYLEQKS